MIFTDRTVIVQKGTSSINDTIVLYRGDREVQIRFSLNEGSPFKFGSGASPNIIEKTEAAYGQLVIKTPGNLPPIFSEVAPTIEGKIVFTITAEMIDEITEVGNYTFQIRLLDESRNSRATLPEVKDGIEIREPIALEDISTTNEVEVAAVGYALTTAGTQEDIFDAQGNYNKTTWGTGDRITAAKLNKIEAGIDGVNKKVVSGGAGSTAASGVSIQDTANNFTSTNVEGALQEVGSQIKDIKNGLYIEEAYSSNNCLGFNNSTEAIAKNGVTLTVTDGVFELNGTASANTELSFMNLQNSPALEAGEYTFRKETISGTTTSHVLRVYYTGDKMFDINETAAKTVALAVTQNRLKFLINSGAQYTNYKFRFWGQAGSTCDDYKEYGSGTRIVEKHKQDFDNLNTHIANDNIHITAEEKQAISELAPSFSPFVDEINDTADKVYNNMNGQCLSFAWMSDTHTYPNYDSHNSSVNQYLNQINTIKFVNEKAGFDMLVHGGDMVNTQWLWKHPTTTNEAYGRLIHDYVNGLRRTGIDNIYVCMGNHDGGFIPNDTGSEVGTEYSSYACFYKNSKQSRNDNKGKVVRDGTKPYYYVDFDSLKLRCIFLATDMDSTTTDWKGIDYDQALWIKNTLENIQQDYNVMLFTHIPITRFYTAMTKSGSTIAVINLLNGFNNHTAVGNSSSSLDADFSNKTGKILACFSGHYHGDSIILPTDERAKFTFPEITITAGGYLSNGVITSGDFSDAADAPARDYGTVTQNAWDAVVYSKADNKIYLTRFGAGEDRVINLP